MEAISDFFSAIFTPILYQPLLNALIFLAWLIPGHSIGWAILILTIIIRALLLPSSWKTYIQQRRIQALQPKLNELKDKHGDDRAAHSKAIMELYAAERVNPLGGCLPTLVQLPILVALYQVFINGLSTESFRLLYPFTPHDPTINTFWFGLDLAKPERLVLPVLVGLAQYVQARQMMALTQPAKTGNKQQDDVSQMMTRQMTIIMPIMIYFFTLQLPAALGLYWLATTLFMMGQQAWFNRRPLPAMSNTIRAKNNVTVTIRTKGSKELANE